MTKLTFPFNEEKIRALKVGDEVLISGTVFTGRDAVHKYLHEGGTLPDGVTLVTDPNEIVAQIEAVYVEPAAEAAEEPGAEATAEGTGAASEGAAE